MTPILFSASLKEELMAVTSHIRLKTPLGEESGLNIFEFGLPIEMTKEDSGKKFPYILITLTDGYIQGVEAHKVCVHLLIGVYDDGRGNQGKSWVLNIINDICERFLVDPVLEGRYYADDEVKWAIDDEERYPYYYGMVEMVFNLPASGRENEYA